MIGHLATAAEYRHAITASFTGAERGKVHAPLKGVAEAGGVGTMRQSW